MSFFLLEQPQTHQPDNEQTSYVRPVNKQTYVDDAQPSRSQSPRASVDKKQKIIETPVVVHRYVDVPVEKIVERIVYVPVEKIVERIVFV